METQKSGETGSQQPVYWIAAAAMTLAAVLDFGERRSFVKVVSGLLLAAVFALTATWGPRSVGNKRVVLWTLLIVACALIVARLVIT